MRKLVEHLARRRYRTDYYPSEMLSRRVGDQQIPVTYSYYDSGRHLLCGRGVHTLFLIDVCQIYI